MPHKTLALAILAAVTLAILPATASAQARAGGIDMTRALRESDAGQRAQAQLRQIYNTRQTDLDHRQAQLRTQREQLERSRGAIPDDDYNRQVAAFTGQLSGLQQDFASYQQDLQRREEELTRGMLEMLRAIARELRARRGYDVIVDLGAVVDGTMPASADLTAEAVQIFNARYGRTPRPEASPRP
ncbi:MAG: OmpH family outer membrane protein [Deltaproteobacteria bacterium]